MFKTTNVTIFAFVSIACTAQTNPAPVVTNWGNIVSDTQLAIHLTNKVIYAGTTDTLACWVKNNSSSNLMGTLTTTQFYAFLTNGSGSFYELTQNPNKVFFISRTGERSIRPGETAAWNVTLRAPRDAKPGNYKLLVERAFFINGNPSKSYNLLSNPLEIQVQTNAPSTIPSSTNAPANPNWPLNFGNFGQKPP